MNKHQAPIVLASLHTPVRHDSGPKHVAGSAEYIDDMIEPEGTVHAYLALSTRAHAEIAAVDFAAAKAAPGVIGILTAEDIPGENDVSPSHKHDEPVFAEDYQPISDMRASADYRLLAAQNLLRRFFLETTGQGQRLRREVA